MTRFALHCCARHRLCAIARGVLAVALLSWAAGCDAAHEHAAGSAPAGDSPSPRDAGGASIPFTAVVTTGMVGDIVHNVAGDRAKVHALMGAGVDPHLYRPTRDDVSALLNADIVFYNGLNLEGKMADTFIKVAGSGKPVRSLTNTSIGAPLMPE